MAAQLDFIRIWFPPINLYSAPSAVRIIKTNDTKMIEIPSKHKAFHEEWIMRGKPQIEWKLATEPDTAYRLVNGELALGPIWASSFDYRFAERRASTASIDPETELQEYWYKKGYHKALADMRDNIAVLSAKRNATA